MLQAKFVDLDYWFRRGGVNWALTKANQDAVAIQAGIGTWASPLLAEQVEGALAHDVPYFTWWIPDVSDGSMSSQVDFYLGLPGVAGHLTCVDLEPPGGGTRCVNGAEAYAAIRHIEDATGQSPLPYSNLKYITEDLKSPSWIHDYWWWLAQYLYKVWPLTFYSDYTSFLAKYPGVVPPSAARLGLQNKVVAWQFSHKGDAQSLCANANTLDPVYTGGIRECDISVSTIEFASFLGLLGPVTPPSPPDPLNFPYRVVVDTLNVRTGPSTNYPIVAQLHSGDTGQVQDTGGTDVWFKIADNRWIASYTGGKRYAVIG